MKSFTPHSWIAAKPSAESEPRWVIRARHLRKPLDIVGEIKHEENPNRYERLKPISNGPGSLGQLFEPPWFSMEEVVPHVIGLVDQIGGFSLPLRQRLQSPEAVLRVPIQQTPQRAIQRLARWP